MYKLCNHLVNQPILVACVSYALALAYLLMIDCPLIFAVFVAFPLALMVGIPVMCLAGFVVIGKEIFETFKLFIQINSKP